MSRRRLIRLAILALTVGLYVAAGSSKRPEILWATGLMLLWLVFEKITDIFSDTADAEQQKPE